jgi:hypothetical protein
MRAILINLPRRIANFQTNASAPNAQSQANICQGIGIGKANIPFDSARLNEKHPHRATI